MSSELLAHFLIGKIADKFYVYPMSVREEVVVHCLKGQGPFHTVEDAHLWLIDKAKELSLDDFKISCVEVVNEYMFIYDKTKNEI